MSPGWNVKNTEMRLLDMVKMNNRNNKMYLIFGVIINMIFFFFFFLKPLQRNFYLHHFIFGLTLILTKQLNFFKLFILKEYNLDRF